MNGITIYKGDTKSLTIEIPATTSLSGYTSILSVSDKEMSGTTIFTCTGTTISGDLNQQQTTFTITQENNNIEPRVYFYQVYIISGDEKITVTSDTYSVLPSLT